MLLKPRLPHIILLFVFFSYLTAEAIPIRGREMLISAPSPYAVEVGKKVLQEGGNVVDVAVAVGLTLAVTSPYFASFGGGGFALVKVKKHPVEALDFRETAPKKTHPDFYTIPKKLDSKNGGPAVGVPGVAAGLYELHKKYGKLRWQKLFEGPLRLAYEGFQVSGEWIDRTSKAKDRFNYEGKKHFFKNKKMYKPGELLKQPKLAKFLRSYKKQGPKYFYQDEPAQDIVNTVKKNGGVLTLNDLKNYKVIWRKPMVHKFKNYNVNMMPLPSSGGIVITTALALIEKLNLAKYEPLSVNELHLLGEILNRSFRGRALLGDSKFHKSPTNFLLSENYLNLLSNSINLSKATNLPPLKDAPPAESKETTHYSVLDKDGNSVAITVTLNGNYGSGLISERYGITLNNEMDDFTTEPNKPNMYGLVQGKGNYVEAGKRPLSSMSPTLVTKNNKVVLSLGAPGGPTIISGVLQVLYRVLVSGMNVDQAIQAPRVHHQFLPKKLFIDNGRFQPATKKGLKAKGHVLTEKPYIGRVNAVYLKENGELEAAYDSRGEGAAGGL